MTTHHYKNNNHIKGDYNQVIQIILTNGEKIEETLGSLVKRLTQKDKEHIETLQRLIKVQEASLKDKEDINLLLDEKLLKLRSELAQAREDLEASEERFAQEFLKNDGQDFSGSRELYALAVSAMVAGDSDKALEILNRQALLEKKKKREQQLEQDADEWLLRAKLLKEKNEWGEELDECYEMAVEVWPSWGNCLVAGDYFYYINTPKKSNTYYQLSLEKASSPNERATTMNNLALLQDILNNNQLALDNHLEALKINRQLAKNSPSVFLSSLANTLNNLASLQDKINNQLALENYQEALKIYRQLTLENPHIFLPYLAGTLNNLALLQDKLNNNKLALEHFLEALKIYRQLMLDNSTTSLHYLAGALNNLANLHDKLNNNDQALDNYLEALKIRKQLALDNPPAFLPGVAMTLNNLAILQKKLNKNQLALENFLEALRTYRQLILDNPTIFLPYLAAILNNLASLQDKLNNNQLALDNYLEALRTYRQLVLDNPSTFLPYLANTLNNLACLYYKLNNNQLALDNFLEALKIRQELASKAPAAFELDLANTLTGLSIFYIYKIPNIIQAKNNAKKALALYQKYEAQVPKAKKWADKARAILANPNPPTSE